MDLLGGRTAAEGKQKLASNIAEAKMRSEAQHDVLTFRIQLANTWTKTTARKLGLCLNSNFFSAYLCVSLRSSASLR